MTLPLPWDFRSATPDGDKIQDSLDQVALQFPVKARDIASPWPACLLRLAATGAYATGTLLQVTNWTTVHDPLSMGSSTTITVPYAGLWMVTVKIGFQTGAGNRRLVIVRKNGADDNLTPRVEVYPGASLPTMMASGPVKLAASDALDVAIYHENGANLNILGNTGGSDSSTFSVYWIGRTA